MRFSHFLAGCATCLLWCALADAGNPNLQRLAPFCGQRGTEVDVVLSGDRLGDAEEILLYDTGMEVVDLKVDPDEKQKDKRVHARFKIAADCPLGGQRLRLRTKSGLSRLMIFHVGPLPIVDEKEPNTEFETPQTIEMNVAVAGRVDREDVDYYQFEAKKGDRISAEIFGTRFGNSGGTLYFDPYLAILNANRFELAVSDDTPLLFNDSAVSIIAPEDGKYYIQVRDASYNGDGRAEYVLHVGNFPRPLAVLPSGGKPGETLDVTFLGDVAGPVTQKVTLPATIPVDRFGIDFQDEHGIPPSSIPFRISELENIVEQEPNNDVGTATAGPAPGAFNGVISDDGDVDFFKFSAKKDQQFQIDVYARRLRSGLDSVLSVHRVTNGQQLAADDDAKRPDSSLKFKAPEDGEFAIAVRDHLRRGNPSFSYRVEITPVEPTLVAEPVELARYVQSQIIVPQGGGIGIVANIQRRDFGGPVNFRSEDLPPGVRIECPESWRSDGTASVFFYADEDAPISGKFSTIEAFLDDPKQPDRKVTGRLQQDVLMVRARNNDRVVEERMHRLPVIVVEKAPFKCWIDQPAVPLVKNGSMNLKIHCERAEGWDEDIRLLMLQNPPGVSSNRSVVIKKGETEAEMSVNASDKAAVRESTIAIRCIAKVNGQDYESLTPPVTLRVEDPYLNFEFVQGAVEQGKESPYLVKVTKNKDFEGEATVELLGLPAKASAEKLTMTKETQELLFTVKAAPDTPPGMTKNLLCRVLIPENGTTILHNIGTGRLRVDKPAPPPKNPEKKDTAPAAVAKTSAPPKPLSRLEQLRLQQQQKRAAGGSQ